MLAFTECMRDHGVDMPDPQPAGDGEGRVITMEGEEMDRERFEEAQEACEPLMEEVVGDIERDPEREAEMREQMLEFAQCMRDHGIDMPDPTFSDDGRVEIGVGGDGREIDPDEMDAANEACAGDDMFMAAPSRAGEAGEDGGDGEPMRVWPMLGGAAVLVGAAGIAGVVVSGSSGDDGSDTDAPQTTVERTVVEVARTDLARTEELDGSIGHGESRPLVLTADGTLTGLPAAGDVIEPGGVVAEVDGQPIVALPGRIPLWRPLGPGVEDGADVLQLEYVLASLGLRRGARRDRRRRLDGGDHRGRRGLPGGPRPGRRRRDQRRRGRSSSTVRSASTPSRASSVSRPPTPGSRSPAPSRPCTSTSTSTTPSC